MTKEIILNTKKELADYYLNREFSQFDYPLMVEMQKAGLGEINIINPSDEYYFDEFANNRGDCDTISSLEEFRELDNVDLIEEFEEEMQENKDSNSPMWNTIFKIDNNMKAEYYEKNVDALKNIGIGLLEFKDEYYLFIAGCGYNFYDAHWIPLFTKFFKWIDEDCGKKFETIKICKNDYAIFTGSEELQNSIYKSFDCDKNENKGTDKITLESLKKIVDIYENPYREELDLLISELDNNNFEHLRIEY